MATTLAPCMDMAPCSSPRGGAAVLARCIFRSWGCSAGANFGKGALASRRTLRRCTDRASPIVQELQPIVSEAQLEELLMEAQSANTVIVIEWMAKWCRKCIYLKPQLEKLAMEFQQGAKFFFVDVNAVPQALVKRAGVTKMPTIQLWKNREKQSEIVAGQKVWLVIDEVREMLQASLDK